VHGRHRRLGVAPNYADFNNETYPGYLGDITYSHAYPDPSEDLKQGDNWSQNTAAFSIKEGSRISISISRSNSRLTFHTTTTRYNDDFDFGLSGAWQRWDNVKLPCRTPASRTNVSS
jgi:hypothetical protein